MGKEFTERKMRMDKLRRKKGYICDMDGVIYHGNLLLDGAAQFVHWLEENQKKYIFLTNSSERSPRELQEKLGRLGLHVGEEQMCIRDRHNVVLSIDGRREVHDFMRPSINGKGSYDLVLKNARAFAKKRGDKSYYVRGTFTARNLDFANDVFALADAGFEQISIEPVVLPSDSPYALTEDMLPTIFAEYDRLAAEYIKRRRDGRWFNFFHFMVDLDHGPCVKKRVKGCGAGGEYVAVTPEGDIYPCHQFVGRPGFRMGSVLNEEFDTAMQSRFEDNCLLTKPQCSSCWARF